MKDFLKEECLPEDHYHRVSDAKVSSRFDEHIKNELISTILGHQTDFLTESS